MPWIQNVSMSDVKRGLHFEAGENSMLIQIVDPAYEFPAPLKQFKEVHQFEFLDVEATDSEFAEFACTQEQADRLVELLQHAMDKRMNVLVHCHAGVCRSGAVCEVGVMMGFNDTEVFRSPNLLVKHLMMKRLGWTYDSDEKHSTNGYTTSSGIIVPPQTLDWSNDNEKVFTLADARRKYRFNTGEDV
jgi:rhodanese-related sulfurtransferase